MKQYNKTTCKFSAIRLLFQQETDERSCVTLMVAKWFGLAVRALNFNCSAVGSNLNVGCPPEPDKCYSLWTVSTVTSSFIITEKQKMIHIAAYRRVEIIPVVAM